MTARWKIETLPWGWGFYWPEMTWVYFNIGILWSDECIAAKWKSWGRPLYTLTDPDGMPP